jgi:hypothetical protein
MSFNLVRECAEENQGRFKFNGAYQPPANADDVNLFGKNESITQKNILAPSQDGLDVRVQKTNYIMFKSYHQNAQFFQIRKTKNYYQ